MKLVHDNLVYSAEKFPNRLAIIDGKRQINYQSLYFSSKSLGNHLSKLQNRGHIIIAHDNSSEFIIAFYAVIMSGMVAVPVDTDISDRNLKYIIDDVQPVGLFCSTKFLRSRDWIKNFDFFVDNRSNLLTDSLDLDLANELVVSENDVAVILYTSGTTGPQKGTCLTHTSLVSAHQNIIRALDLDEIPSLVESIPMRFSHSFGLARVRIVIALSGTICIEKGLIRPDRLLRNINTYNVNVLCGVPTAFDILLSNYHEEVHKIAKKIVSIELGSSPISKRLQKQICSTFENAKIKMHYGLTEASRSTFKDLRVLSNSVGYASPNVEIAIENADKEGFGEILIKGRHAAVGYLNKPKETEETFHNGWVRTGDIGALSDTGELHLLSRKSDLINISGLKVVPQEVEVIINLLPECIESAVCGMKGDNYEGEFIIAFIKTKTRIELSRLQNHFKINLENYKIPEKVVFVDEIPKTDNGKIKRNELISKWKEK